MHRKLAACGSVGVVLACASAAVALANHDSDWRVRSAVVGALTVLVPVGVGLYEWRRDPANRHGPLLVLLGYGWFLATLAASSNTLLYSTGRVAAWLVEPPLIYLSLAYPYGHLTRRSHRIIVASAWTIALAAFLPNVLLLGSLPTPTVWSTCVQGCPGNAFAVAGGVVDHAPIALLLTLQALVTLLFAAVVAAIWQRLRRASPLMGRTLAPVLAATLLRYVAYVIYLTLLRSGVDGEVLVPLAFLIELCLPIAALSFLVGLLSCSMHAARALETLTVNLQDPEPDDETLRRLLSEAVEDPFLELFYAGDGDVTWRDGAGRGAVLPANDGDRCVVQVPDTGQPVAALVLDGALRDQAPFVHAVGACAFTALERRRLTTALSASEDDVEASRARLFMVADSERRRIQRDLHDGLQQRLVMLRIRLGLASEPVEESGDAVLPLLDELGSEVEGIIDDFRMVTRTIYPSLLTDAGVGEALRAVAVRAPLPVSVTTEHLRRYPIEVESAIYFCALEALQNALKHARGASQVSVVIRDDGTLRLDVRDDGAGFDLTGSRPGAGLTNMRDRIQAVAGDFSIESHPGRGTNVRGTVPLTPTDPTGRPR
ncbi:MAG: sensor histidine kinase [Nocardioidaceae bacterium]